MRHFFLTALVIAAPVSAETLPDAIASAYASNPEIAAARARLQQVDEGVPLAASAMRPFLNVESDFTQELSERAADEGQIFRGGIVLRQPLYEGGRVRANISAAQARIGSARATLRAAELAVITDTVTAYSDVLRSEALVRLNEGQVKVLEQQLRASRDRFEVGDLTRTDVAQSEARLAAASANLQLARAQLTVSRQAYRRLIDREPQNLAPLPPLPPIPASAEAARDVALGTNPSLAASRFAEKAASQDVRAAKAGRGPSIGLVAGARYVQGMGDLSGLTGFSPDLGVTAGMPLFTGGLIAAQVRQAQARQSEALETITQTERLVVENTINNWTLLRTSEAVIESAKVQVNANALAAEGVRQENQVGSRDILDVLNAEQELLNARVSLVQAERDRYVNAYRLFESIGDIETVLQGVPVGRYDPAANAERVSGKGWNEFSYDPDPRKDRLRNTVPIMGPQQ